MEVPGSRLTEVSREAKKAQSARPTKKNATTTVSHLHDGTVSQFSKILHHILGKISDSRKDSPFISQPLCWYYTPHEISEQFVQSLVDRVDIAHTL